MGFTSNPARVERTYVGLLDDVSAADSVENEVASCLSGPFTVRRIFGHITTGVTTASVTTSLYWRPTPGSTTNQVLIATFELPVAAADTLFYVDLNHNDDTGTTIGAAGPTSVYGIAGSTRYTGEADIEAGPGGSLFVTAPDGEAGAGACNIWIDAELLSMESASSLVTLTAVTPDVIGA